MLSMQRFQKRTTCDIFQTGRVVYRNCLNKIQQQQINHVKKWCDDYAWKSTLKKHIMCQAMIISIQKRKLEMNINGEQFQQIAELKHLGSVVLTKSEEWMKESKRSPLPTSSSVKRYQSLINIIQTRLLSSFSYQPSLLNANLAFDTDTKEESWQTWMERPTNVA